MARRPNQYVELDGPIFDKDVRKRVKGGIAQGIAALTELGEEIAVQYVHASFYDTGTFAANIKGTVKRSKGAGYGKVAMDVQGRWPTPDRPTATWMETGMRAGVKLRKGTYAFRKTRTRVNAERFSPLFLGPIVEALE